MDIYEEIIEESINHKLGGKDATRVYLGRNQMKELILWAGKNIRETSLNTNDEGDHRLQINGMLCWQVNDDDHLVVA